MTKETISVPHSHYERTAKYYRRLIDALREVAREKGYCLAVHGSLVRDIDLVACPWTRECVSQKDLAEAIRAKAEEIIGHAALHPAESTDFFQAGCPGMKPHGRLAWSFHLGGGPYLDLSVMLPLPDYEAPLLPDEPMKEVKS